MSAGRGKTFEREIKAYYESNGALVHRNYDGMTGNQKFSVKSRPDLTVFTKNGWSLLVECKSVKGKSIPYGRIKEHQLQELVEFDRHSRFTQAYVALNYYNGELGKKRVNKAIILPILAWVIQQESSTKKSLSYKEAEELGEKLYWVPGVNGGWFNTKQMQRMEKEK